MTTNHADIRIGTLAKLDDAHTYLPQILPHGFESFSLTSWARVPEGINWAERGQQIRDICGDQAVISSIGVYGNPMRDDFTRDAFAEFIRNAHHFGAKVVCGFAGAIEEKKIDEQMDEFRATWEPLAKLAEDHGVKIAFENCDMGGYWERPAWNIAHSPRAWEMMFDAVPSDAMGLQWEPCHQMVSFIDPLPQLRKWVGKIHHVHGKDATVAHDLVRELGTRSGKFVVFHRTPGFGDTNWADLITILRQAKWEGCIDIEGWHDPVYRDDLEMTGQVFGLNYLKACRGGPFVPNPS
ncbi:MAG: sugar phosphate isomerase/epimerase [Chthonomonas sp.]|nr:sugar phosphate isomerase/epimerase [Chthonomonas sp.]